MGKKEALESKIYQLTVTDFKKSGKKGKNNNQEDELQRIITSTETEIKRQENLSKVTSTGSWIKLNMFLPHEDVQRK